MAAPAIRDYGAVLEMRQAGIRDATELPYPKEVIKQAILAALRSTSDDKARDQLSGGLLFPSDWQPGVGLKPVALTG